MVATAYEDDVVELASAILAVGGRPEGSLLLEALDPIGDEFYELTIEISGQTHNLDETLAALGAVQPAFGTGVIIDDYRAIYRNNDLTADAPASDDLVRVRLRELCVDPSFALEIVEIGEYASFKATFKKVVSSKWARRGGVAAIVVTGIVLTVFFPVPGAVVAVVGVVAGLANEGLSEIIEDRLRATRDK